MQFRPNIVLFSPYFFGTYANFFETSEISLSILGYFELFSMQNNLKKIYLPTDPNNIQMCPETRHFSKCKNQHNGTIL